MRVSTHFDLREFVPKPIWDQYGTNSLWFINTRLIESAEFMRMFFSKPILLNTWHIGGKLQNRGFRTPQTTVGGRLSQHRFGRAIDFNVSGMADKDVQAAIVENWTYISRSTSFTTMEDGSFTPTWTHLDMRQTRSTDLLIVKP